MKLKPWIKELRDLVLLWGTIILLSWLAFKVEHALEVLFPWTIP